MSNEMLIVDGFSPCLSRSAASCFRSRRDTAFRSFSKTARCSGQPSLASAMFTRRWGAADCAPSVVLPSPALLLLLLPPRDLRTSLLDIAVHPQVGITALFTHTTVFY